MTRSERCDVGVQTEKRSNGDTPSSPCPKCGIRPRRQANGTRGYCKECDRDWHRVAAVRKKSDRTPCPHCGGKHHKRCPARLRAYLIRRGREKVNERWPGYGDLLPEDCLRNAGANWPRTVAYPHPSAIFVGLDPALDRRLIRDQYDKNVTLCRALAALPTTDQREYYELHLKDPGDAQRWAALPKWKRPIRHGDADDQRIWKFFTMQRLNMEQAAADYPPWALASQGMQLPQMFGVIRDLTPEGLKKLCLVMSTYGLMLGHSEDVGNVLQKPWPPSVHSPHQAKASPLP